MATLNTTNSIGFKFALFATANGSRTKYDGATMGFAATPSANVQEAVLSPASTDPVLAATVLTLTVRSVIFIRTSARVKLTVTKQDNSSYVQIVNSVFALSPSEAVTITVETAEPHNVSAKIVWS